MKIEAPLRDHCSVCPAEISITCGERARAKAQFLTVRGSKETGDDTGSDQPIPLFEARREAIEEP